MEKIKLDISQVIKLYEDIDKKDMKNVDWHDCIILDVKANNIHLPNAPIFVQWFEEWGNQDFYHMVRVVLGYQIYIDFEYNAQVEFYVNNPLD